MAQHISNANKIETNNTIWYGIGIFDYLNTSGIYAGYLTPFLMEIFKRVLQNIFFPLYALASLVYMVLSIRHLFLDKDLRSGKLKNENIIRVVVNISSAVLVTAAVVTTLAFSAVVGVGSTVLFAANLAVSGIYNAVCAAYFFSRYVKVGKALRNPALTPEDRMKLEEERKMAGGKSFGYLIVGITIVMVAAAGAMVMFGGLLPLAAIGIVAGVIGATFCIYAIAKMMREKKLQRARLADCSEQPEAIAPGTTAKLLQTWDCAPSEKFDDSAVVGRAPPEPVLHSVEESRPLLSVNNTSGGCSHVSSSRHNCHK